MGNIEHFRLKKPVKITKKMTDMLKLYSAVAYFGKTHYKKAMKHNHLRWEPIFGLLLEGNMIKELNNTASNIGWKDRFRKEMKSVGIPLKTVLINLPRKKTDEIYRKLRERGE